MRVDCDTDQAKKYVKMLRERVKQNGNIVKQVVIEDSHRTQQDFDNAGNTTLNNDDKVIVKRKGNTITERASGTEVYFKEFGTGVYANHPLGSSKGFVRGSYGKGQGSNPEGWVFAGESGITGEYAEESGSTGEVTFYRTFGQPASMPMYNSFQRLSVYVIKAIKENILRR